VADYSEALLPWLRRLGTVLENQPGDVNLYHIGNNPLHAGIYERALREPGVVVIHDAILHHFLLGALDRDRYVEEFAFNYGEFSKDLVRELWAGRARSGSDPRYFAYPMLKRVARAARGIVVHNPAAARIVREHAPGVEVVEIPHLFDSAAFPSDGGNVRAALGIPEGALLAGTFGHQRETKRPHVLLRAFHRALAEGADLWLLFAGEFVSESFGKSVAPLLEHSRIRRVGHLDAPAFRAHLAAADVCLNLRCPTAGETSGVAISAMGMGKAVVFTAGAEIERFPENACLRIAAGPGEETSLAELLAWLASRKEIAAAIGSRAAAWIREHHDPARVAERYWAVCFRD
jgi:glycosyltransferase involved in cell wall biosynthesis